MKKISKLFAFLMMLGVMSLITSCEPDTYELGDKLAESEIDFQVIQDYSIDEGGNTIIFINNTPGTIAVWDYGAGVSRKALDTIRIAFQGEYTIKRTAVTAGGTVELDPIIITVTDDNLNYVNDPLWTALSGGVGNEKSWFLDIDAKYFDGPMYFYGTDNGWLLEGNEWAGGDTGCYGDDCWNWSPVYADNMWLLPDGDYGIMTFSLDGGPFFTAEKPMEGDITEEGTYFLDINTKELTINNASILRGYKGNNAGLAGVSNWTNYTVLSLTEETMQLGVIRDQDIDGEGPAQLVYNFISKEYSDNWVPEDLPEPEPVVDLNGETAGDLISVTPKTWSLSPDTPYNSTDLSGNFLNSWSSIDDYVNAETGYGPAYQNDVANSKIIFSANGTVKTIDHNNNEVEGNYTVTEGTNVISFSGITPSFNIGESVVATTTSQNEWKIVKTGLTGDIVTDIWFGKRDESTPTPLSEYMVFHFVLDQGGPIEEPETVINFDNSKLVVGDLESNGNLRLELFNEYGPTNSDPPLNRSDLVFNNSVEVTFTLSGITLNPGAVGTYNASMYYADSDWNPQGNGSAIEVTGDGTYTVTFAPGSSVDGVIVFVIDIVAMATDIADISAVTANIDSIVIE